jgi:TM2 domain-containing membrane protein YozV
MDCVNHQGVAATAYCQNCGKPLCATCVRNAGNGQILCEPCLMAWQNVQQPFVAPASGPNPSVAAVLGIIPGVGAMYNGQYFKGLIHVVIFVVIISITTHYGLFGLFIPAWVLYQSFEAFHTAKAIRDGQPMPDPLGLNEVGNWFNLGGTPGQHRPGQPGVPMGQPGVPVNPGPGPGSGAATGTGGYQQVPYTQYPYAQGQAAYAPPPGYVDPAVPPVPPVPPVFWKRKEPIGALILIGFGLLLLMNQLGFLAERVIHILWPLIFIAIGVWLVIRRIGDTPQMPPPGAGNGTKGGAQ